MSRPGRVVLSAVSVAAGTWFGAWFAPAIWGLAAGIAWRRERVGLDCAIGAALGWGVLLALPAVRGAPMQLLAEKLGVTVGIPAALVVIATLVLPALLAGSASALVSCVAGGSAPPVAGDPRR